jgi:hypothetical protein
VPSQDMGRGQPVNDETWRDQFKRVCRSARLVAALAEGTVPELLPEQFDPEDAVYHFCADAFHLRDWIAAAGVDPAAFPNTKEFGKVLKARCDQLDEEVFKQYPALAACRDIANGYKHLTLTGSSFLPGGKHSEIAGREFNVRFGEGPRNKFKYTVRVGESHVDAVQLSKMAMANWDRWFATTSSIARELRAEVRANPWSGWPWEPAPWGILRGD